MKKPFYITTTLPYVNADPHVGFAVELVRADIIARAKKLAGHEVFFNTGTDEHGSKIEKTAAGQGIDPQKYVDEKAKKYLELLPTLGILPEANFIRTTDAHHVAAAQEFWRIVYKNGFIYKKDYSIKYCVGCELEKTDSELVDGHCPLHPHQEIEIIKEENYFFKFSAFQKQLFDLYKKNQALVVPDFRFNEIKAFVARGLDDFSISRLKSKMSWGIPVPDDENQVMYVWFDALVNYIIGVGWPCSASPSGRASHGKPDDHKDCEFEKWWIDSGGAVQYCGKDNLRQQSAMWQAMLMAASLPPSQTDHHRRLCHWRRRDKDVKVSRQYSRSARASKTNTAQTLCATLFPRESFARSKTARLRMEKFKDAYNSGLANGLGNLVLASHEDGDSERDSFR